MKKILLYLSFIAFTQGVYAENKPYDETKISAQTKEQFEANFQGAKNVIWSASDLTQNATFTLNSIKMIAYFDLSGKYLGAARYANYYEIPYKVLKEITQTYSGYSATSVFQITDRPESSENNDIGLYIVALSNSSKQVQLRVSPDGFLSLVKENQKSTLIAELK